MWNQCKRGHHKGFILKYMLKHILFKKVYIFGPESPATNSGLKTLLTGTNGTINPFYS